MSNNEHIGSSHPFLLDNVNTMNRTPEIQEDCSEIREDIGTPLDDEPELGDNSAIAALNIDISQHDPRLIDEEVTCTERVVNKTGGQVAADTIT